MIIAGASAYSRVIDWERFRAIADKCGALLMVGHGALRRPGRRRPLPVARCRIADFVTTTTHKTLRGPRGGLILGEGRAGEGGQLGDLPRPAGRAADARDRRQGGGASRRRCGPEFKDYQEQVIEERARHGARRCTKRGLRIVSGRTDSHLFLVDLRAKNITGKDAEDALGRAHITVNKNAIPNDPQKPMVTCGIRIGSPAMTTRGFGAGRGREARPPDRRRARATERRGRRCSA